MGLCPRIERVAPEAAIGLRTRCVVGPRSRPAPPGADLCREHPGVSAITVRTILLRHGLDLLLAGPAQRGPSSCGHKLSLVYFLVARLLGAGSRPQDEKDIELLVLRHQVKVIQRHVKRPRLRHLDRLLLAAASRAMPRDLWSSFVVRRETVRFDARWSSDAYPGRASMCNKPPRRTFDTANSSSPSLLDGGFGSG